MRESPEEISDGIFIGDRIYNRDWETTGTVITRVEAWEDEQKDHPVERLESWDPYVPVRVDPWHDAKDTRSDVNGYAAKSLEVISKFGKELHDGFHVGDVVRTSSEGKYPNIECIVIDKKEFTMMTTLRDAKDFIAVVSKKKIASGIGGYHGYNAYHPSALELVTSSRCKSGEDVQLTFDTMWR